MTDNAADVTEQDIAKLQLSPRISFACRTSLQEILPPCRCIPGLNRGLRERLYPRPIGAAPAHIRPRSFPVWNIQVAGKEWQEAMFLVADRIAYSAFYVAADTGTPKTEWLGVSQNLWGVHGRLQFR